MLPLLFILVVRVLVSIARVDLYNTCLSGNLNDPHYVGANTNYQLLTCDICRYVTFMSQNRLASAMDRSIRVSMKNAASCVIYHELQTLRVVKF